MTDSNKMDVDDDGEDRKPFMYFEAAVQQKLHHFYISEVISEPSRYVEMIHKIKTAGPSDIIYLYLNTPGGRFDTGIQIIAAMNMSQAHVVTVLEGDCCSMGTALFLSGDEFVVHNHCTFMIHNYTGGVYGKGHEQVAALATATTEAAKFLRSIYIPFVNENEIEKIINGADLWMGSDEVRTRLTKMVKTLEKERKAEEKKMIEDQRKVPRQKKNPKKKS